ncbi:MAG: CheY-like chemotaxis protein [Cellvibrionaceae bacterium]|jgi:CheY-like chemotaxis protein
MASKKTNKRKKVLLVDDNHETLEIIRHLIELREAQIDVVDAPSAEEGMLSLSGIDALVTDLRLPGMSGIDLIKRAHRRNSNLPVIIISGVNESDAKSQIGNTPIVAFVSKPYKPDQLIDLIIHTVWGDDAPGNGAASNAYKQSAVAKLPEPPAAIIHAPLSSGAISSLEKLQSGTHAYQVALWALDGALLYVFNEKERSAIEKLGKLGISSIASGLEMLVRSGSKPTRLITILDGEPYQIVLAYIKSKEDFCLAIVVDGGVKLGVILGAVQRTVADLAIRLNSAPAQPAEPVKQAVTNKKAIATAQARPKKQTQTPPARPKKQVPQPVIQVNPIASDEDLEKLLNTFSEEIINDNELDNFWASDPVLTSSNVNTQPVKTETVTELTPTAVASNKPEGKVKEATPKPIEIDPIASDEDLEKLLNAFSREAVSDSELDNFWETEPDLLGDRAQTQDIVKPALEPIQSKSADAPGLAGILVDHDDVVDERWEEVRGMLAVENEAEEFWEQAVEEDLTSSNLTSSNLTSPRDEVEIVGSEMLSYEEALERGLLGD